jgi:hypothetical protein
VPSALEALTSWIDEYRLETERRFRRMDAVLKSEKEQEKKKAGEAANVKEEDKEQEQ